MKVYKLIIQTFCIFDKILSTQIIFTQVTYGKGPECQFLKSAFCPLFGVLTYSSIKFGLSIEIEGKMFLVLEFCNFDTF